MEAERKEVIEGFMLSRNFGEPERGRRNPRGESWGWDCQRELVLGSLCTTLEVRTDLFHRIATVLWQDPEIYICSFFIKSQN